MVDSPTKYCMVDFHDDFQEKWIPEKNGGWIISVVDSPTKYTVDFHGDFHGVWTDGFDRKDPRFHGGIPW